MKRLVAGLAAAVAVSGLGLLTAGVAQAKPTYCPGPGYYLHEDPWPGFDRSVCHTYHYEVRGQVHGMVDDDTGIFHPWERQPSPAAPAPPPAPCPSNGLDWRYCFFL
jgi:hypothetical protein